MPMCVPSHPHAEEAAMGTLALSCQLLSTSLTLVLPSNSLHTLDLYPFMLLEPMP